MPAPMLHHDPTLIEKVSSRIGCLGLVPDRMGKGGFSDFAYNFIGSHPDILAAELHEI